MKLNKDEMKNIMGGMVQPISVNCELAFSNGQTIVQHCTSQAEVDMWYDACDEGGGCLTVSCQ
jgi:hypothetical protein